MTIFDNAEDPNYQPLGEEIVVADMHTRKKMMFDRVSCNEKCLAHCVL